MSYIYRHIKAVRVVDGDTVELQIDTGFHNTFMFNFRLAGINAPEGKYTETAKFLRELFDTYGVSTLIAQTYKPDKYGRWLVELFSSEQSFINGWSINLELVSKGLASPYMEKYK